MRLIAIISLLLSFGCKPASEKSEMGKPHVVVTTTMLGDLATQIGGDSVNVTTIMKPGGDPHLYQPTPRDAKEIASAQLIVTSGLHLEGWIDDLVQNAGGDPKFAVASKNVEVIKSELSPGGVDPHFWFDLNQWEVAAKNVADGLKTVTPKSDHDNIENRLSQYLEKNKETHDWVAGQLKTIPESQRVLITSHDAFSYFARAYGIEVVAIQGVSTEQEASDRDVVNVVEQVRKHSVPAVFVESSVNPALINQVAKETGVKVSGPLFSDSIGADSTSNSFLKVVESNTKMIVDGLGGKYSPFASNTTGGGK